MDSVHAPDLGARADAADRRRGSQPHAGRVQFGEPVGAADDGWPLGSCQQPLWLGNVGLRTGYHFSRLTCVAPSDLPGSTINVGLGDKGMTQMMGGTAPLGAPHDAAGVAGHGDRGARSACRGQHGMAHPRARNPAPGGGQSAGQRVPGADGKVNETGGLAEASASCVTGAGDGIQAGTVGWVTVTLATGRYELVCNLANHYADGMHQVLIVTSP